MIHQIWNQQSQKQKLQVVLLEGLLLLRCALELLGFTGLVPYLVMCMDFSLVSDNVYVQTAWRLMHCQDQRQFLILLGLGLLGLYLMRYFVQWLSVTRLNQHCFRYEMEIADRIYAHRIYQPYEEMIRRDQADFQQAVIEDSHSLVICLRYLMLICAELLQMMVIGMAMLAVNLAVTLLSIAILLVLVLIYWRVLQRRLHVLGEQRHEFNQRRIRHVSQTAHLKKQILVDERQPYFYQQMAELNQAFCELDMRYEIINAIPNFYFTGSLMIGIVALTLVLLAVMQDPSGSMLNLSVLAALAVKLAPSLQRFVNYRNFIRYHQTPCMAVIRELEEIRDGAADRGQAAVREQAACAESEGLGRKAAEVTQFTFTHALSLHGVTFRYANADAGQPPVLRDITMEIPFGSFVGFTGPSGGGKSTLCDCICGFLRPQSGEICADGRDVFSNLSAWRSKIGYISQDFCVFDDTIRRNIAFGLADEDIDEARLRRAVQDAQLQSVIGELPDGLDTVLGRDGFQLSGGQQQRVAIARALYKDARFLVLDEATSALDMDTEAGVLDAVSALKGRVTVLLIAHRPSALACCDRVYHIVRGQIET